MNKYSKNLKELVYYTAFHKSIRHTVGERECDDCLTIILEYKGPIVTLVKKNGYTTVVNLNNCVAYSYKELEK